MVKVTERKESLVVEVEEEDVFMRHFEGFVRENFESFETDEEYELLLELVTLEDYYLFKR